MLLDAAVVLADLGRPQVLAVSDLRLAWVRSAAVGVRREKADDMKLVGLVLVAGLIALAYLIGRERQRAETIRRFVWWDNEAIRWRS